MLNPHIAERLAGIRQILMGVHLAGGTLSSATKAGERSSFIDEFLSKVLPTPFRFGTGDATDASGLKSGQLDVVIEYPFMPSLPLPAAGESRLYLAEGIAAVIEVKSDVAGQWKEVIRTAEQLTPLRRHFDNLWHTEGKGLPTFPLERIPLFVAGYTGWKTMQTIDDHLGDHLTKGLVQGVLVIDAGLFASSTDFGSVRGHEEYSLWGLISCLHRAMGRIRSALPDIERYIRETP